MGCQVGGQQEEEHAPAAAHAAPLTGLVGVRVVAHPSREPKPEGWTRFVCFSDTHGLHDRIPREHLYKGDVLLHAGDFTNTGELEQVESFAAWLRNYPAGHKVVIAGNHDVTFQEDYYRRAWQRYHPKPYDSKKVREALLRTEGCTYLQDELAVIEGYRVYGSPWQPEFGDWAFNLPPGAPSQEAWARIPKGVHVLLTHGPPYGRNDTTSTGAHAGCKDLLTAIERRAVPVSLAGHLHSGYGVSSDGVTLYINASTCTRSYEPVQPPVVVDVPPPASLDAAIARARAERPGVFTC